jgi:hypothetical protein
MAFIVGPVSAAASGLPGGVSAALDVTATGVIKSSPGLCYRIAVSTVGSTNPITINDSNALVTAQTITAITVATNAVVTISTVIGSNPFAIGNSIAFAGVGGMTQINNIAGLVTAIGGASGAWTITTNINSSAFSAFTSGGTAASFSAANQILSVPAASLTSGQVIVLEWPCAAGILVSSIPTTSLYSISFS